MNKQIVLDVDNLSKSYGELQAVRNLSFKVFEGEIFGIMGPNGAGKSSTIECIVGVRTMSSGKVSVLGMNPEKDRKQLFRQVGVQFQDSAWQPLIKTGELCRATAVLYDPEPDWKYLLEKFGLANYEKTEVNKLSGGEKQKLSILLACMHSPKLVFLDELTTGLDPLARREAWKFIRQIREEGTSIVVSSHYMDEIEALCDRGFVLDGGCPVASGSIAEIKEAGKAKTLDEAYINLVSGQEVLV